MVALHSIEQLPAAFKHGAVAIGNLDGVHLGHQALVHSALSAARRAHTKTSVLTFSPHPQEILHPGLVGHRLTTDSEKEALLGTLSVDAVLFLPFDAQLAALSAAEFFERIVRHGFAAASVHVGEDFRFGARRQGDTQMLGTLCQQAGITLEILPAVEEGGERISSTRVRACLEQGRVEAVSSLLGRPYALHARVEKGSGRGKTLGIPTANLAVPAQKAVPKAGVYQARARSAGQWFTAVCNLGTRPTFEPGATRAVLEAHLLDFSGTLYGEEITLEFQRRIRDERRFENVEALRAQILRDIESARKGS